MNIIVTLITLFWVLRLMHNTLSFIALWYWKEYRFDRMIIHLKTAEGKRLLFIKFSKPPLTPKTILLFLLTTAILTLGYFILPFTHLITLAILDLVLFVVISLLVLLLRIPTIIVHEYKISRAISRLRLHKPMRVIGITGSYGKTSTKEFLRSILETKYSVLATEASKNSPIGIAETVLAKLRDDHEIFIVEMGAYKIGEISRMANMVKPSIGIITAINPQHQDLFGSIENTMKAKYELIAGLSQDRIFICNADNEKTKVMASWAKQEGIKTIFYTIQPTLDKHMIQARNITSNLSGTSFEIVSGKQKVQVYTKLIGEHQASNILAAIAAAELCGMSLQECCHIISELSANKKTMLPVPGINSSVFIDDTFNNNPDAARAAISFLAKSKGKKILVFQPMIELGSYAQSAHEDVGKFAGTICDEIILTNDNFNESFMRGVRNSKKLPKVSVLSAQQTARYIRGTVAPGDWVVFKGKQSDKVLQLLKK